MSFSNKVKITVLSAAVAAAVCVGVPLLISSKNQSADISPDSNTIIAMAPVTFKNSPQCVIVIPSKDNVFEAAVAAYSMWEKINPHEGRPCFTLVPIYGNGQIGKNAVMGYYNAEPGSTTFNFWWRGEANQGHICLKEILIPKNAFEKDSLIMGQTWIHGLLKTNNKIIDSWIVEHSINQKFTHDEIYNNVRQIDGNPVDFAVYDPDIPYERWEGRRQ